MYGVDNPLRAQLPRDLKGEMRARVAMYNDLGAEKPEVDWPSHIRHLPYAELLSSLDEPPGTFEELIARGPGDPAWETGGLYDDSMGWGVPALWFNSWYDVSRSEEHTSELQSLMRISYAVFCLKKKKTNTA